MRLDDGPQRQDRLVAVARQALRWVTDAAVTTDDGATWPLTRAPGAPIADDLYDGSAGVLIALAEAHLTGVTDFDDQAGAAAGRVRNQAEAMLDAWPARAARTPDGAAGNGQEPDPGLYTGLGGAATALDIWAQASGDQQAAAAARALAARLSLIARAAQPVSSWRDLLSGEAGLLLVLTSFGGQDAEPGAARIADRLVGEARWIDGLPDWYPRADEPAFQPNLCHGLAGIALALVAASGPLGRPELLDIAQRAARRLIQLGSRPDGTLVVPHSIPLADPQAPVSFGWCHGPTGTLRLFQALDRDQPGHGWAGWADACRLAVRRSGLPARLYPGFWDNLGQCCGTAGVGEMALDHYQETGDRRWLAWAEELADDVLGRCITDESGTRWSHTEHRRRPQELEPGVGWMQGAAGIAGWLLRLARVRRDGVGAARTSWPDRP
jgi:lantibiotic modifying enzyme